MYACTVRGFCQAFAAPKPAFCGFTLVGFNVPSALYWLFTMVTGSLGLVIVIDVARPVMPAALGALNMSTRSWIVRLPPSLMLRASDRSIALVKHPVR